MVNIELGIGRDKWTDIVFRRFGNVLNVILTNGSPSQRIIHHNEQVMKALKRLKADYEIDVSATDSDKSGSKICLKSIIRRMLSKSTIRSVMKWKKLKNSEYDNVMFFSDFDAMTITKTHKSKLVMNLLNSQLDIIMQEESSVYPIAIADGENQEKHFRAIYNDRYFRKDR